MVITGHSLSRVTRLAKRLAVGMVMFAISGFAFGGETVGVTINVGPLVSHSTLSSAITDILGNSTTAADTIVATIYADQDASSGTGWVWDFGNGNPGGGYINLTLAGSQNQTLTQTMGTGSGDHRLMVLQGVKANSGNPSLTIKNLTYSGGSYNEGAQISDSIRGAGLLVYEIDTGAIVNIGDSGFINNQIDITADGNAVISGNGAGLYLDGRDAGWADNSASKGTVNLDNVIIDGNRVNVAGDTSGIGNSANGGGALINHIKEFNYTNGTVSNNTAGGSNLGHTQGGGISFEYMGMSNPSSFPVITLTNVAFSDNSISLTDGVSLGAAIARGGAFATLTQNSTVTVIVNSSTFQNNTASVSGSMAFAPGGGIALGGAVAFIRAGIGTTTGIFTGGTFANNSAVNETTGKAMGGAIYADAGTTLSLDGVTFNQNKAQATTAANGLGGAVYLANGSTAGTIANSTFTGNEAGYGGALYLDGGEITVTDTSFTGNKATDTGGAVFVDTSVGAGLHKVTIESGLGNKVVFSGNTDSNGANAISFGERANPLTSTAVAELVLSGSGDIDLLDPIKVLMTNQNFSLTNNNTGVVTFGGENSFTTGTGTLDITFGTDSNNVFTNDYTAIANTSGTFTVDGTAAKSFMIRSSRDSDLALFDFTGATGMKQFYFDHNNSTIEIDSSGALFGFEKEYLVADNIGSSDLGVNTEGDYGANNTEAILEWRAAATPGTNDQLWLTVKYAGDAAALARANHNALQAGATGAFNDAMGKSNLTAAQAAGLSANINAAVPGFVLNMAGVGLSGLYKASDVAMKFGNSMYGTSASGGYMGASAVGSNSGLASLRQDIAHCGFRFWTGYIGDFDRMDNNNRLNGYKADRHGFVAGINYDFGTAGTVGFFGGYSHTKTKARDMSAEVKSDAGHFGLIGRFAPIRELSNFAVNADVGYTFTNNDSWRSMGAAGKASASFDQDLFTAGLELEYAINFAQNGFLTPFLAARYAHVKQDAFTETGVMSASVDKFSGDTFHTRLGAALGYDFQTANGGVITPSLSVAWRHEYGDREFSTNAAYNVASPIRFTQRSVKFDRDSADIGASIHAAMDIGGGKKLGLNLGYNLNVGSNQTNHSLYAGFDIGF